MTDPAVEAARRVWARDHIGPVLAPAEAMEDAAREALKPIRAALDQLSADIDQIETPTLLAVAPAMLRTINEIEKHAFTTDEMEASYDRRSAP